MKAIKKLLYALLGLMGIAALLSSLAANSITNVSLMKQGFLTYADTAHLNVQATAYEGYARAICQYLDGKTESMQVDDPQAPGRKKEAFSEKENLHMQDVRALVSLLKIVRWAGGGGVAVLIGALFLLKKRERARLTQDILGGFVGGAVLVTALAVALGIWGACDFRGLFWQFHQLAFSNDLWLLDPAKDLLVALMPLEFFTWYAGQMLLSMASILAMLVVLVIAVLKIRSEEKKKAQ